MAGQEVSDILNERRIVGNGAMPGAIHNHELRMRKILLCRVKSFWGVAAAIVDQSWRLVVLEVLIGDLTPILPR